MRHVLQRQSYAITQSAVVLVRSTFIRSLLKLNGIDFINVKNRKGNIPATGFYSQFKGPVTLIMRSPVHSPQGPGEATTAAGRRHGGPLTRTQHGLSPPDIQHRQTNTSPTRPLTSSPESASTPLLHRSTQHTEPPRRPARSAESAPLHRSTLRHHTRRNPVTDWPAGSAPRCTATAESAGTIAGSRAGIEH